MQGSGLEEAGSDAVEVEWVRLRVAEDKRPNFMSWFCGGGGEEVVNSFHLEGGRSFRFGRITFLGLGLARGRRNGFLVESLERCLLNQLAS